jgi:hypothetical protein
LSGIGQIGIGQLRPVFLGGFEQLSQVRTTPTATRAGAEALAHLAGAAWLLHLQKVQHFSLGNVEAEAKFVVELHEETIND